MSARPVMLREQACRDIRDAVDREAGAAAFVDALETALRRLAERPAAGSSDEARDLDIPGLRSLALPRPPYRIFYVERDGAVDVWRVLAVGRDIPAGAA